MADVKTLTVHGIPYTIKDETARNNIGTLQSTVSGHTDNISSLEETVSTLQSTVSGHTGSISSINGEIDTLQSTVSRHTSSISSINGKVDILQSTVNGHNTLFEKYGSYETDDTAVLWAGTSNRNLSIKTGAVITAHYSVIGRIVFFNIYAAAEILETGEKAWINCPKMLGNFPVLDRSMPIILANQDMVDMSDTEQPSYGIVEDTFIKIYKRNNNECIWVYNNSGASKVIRLSGFYISSNKVKP